MKLYQKVQTKKQRASTFTSLEIQKMSQCQIINSTQAWVKILDWMHLGDFMPIYLSKEKVSDVFVQGGGGTPYKTYGEAPPQRASRIWKGCDFTSWGIWKVTEIGHFGL